MGIFKKTEDKAFYPVWNGSCYELLSYKDVFITQGKTETIDLGISIKLPECNVGVIYHPNNILEVRPVLLKNMVEQNISVKVGVLYCGPHQIRNGDCVGYLSISEVTNFEPLKVKLLTENATAPSAAHMGDAGYDLASAYDTVIPAKGKGLVKTDIAVAIHPGWYGRVAPRSSVAWKNHIDVGAGVIDSKYRGNVGVVLFNHADEDYEISKGDRIAQLIIEKCRTGEIEVVEDLDETERGEGGFGSTGK